MSATTGERDRRRGGSGKGLVALLGLLGAGLVLVLAGRDWVEGLVDVGIGVREVPVTGSGAQPGITGAALVVAAATIVAVTARGWGRLVAGAAMVLAGLGVAALAMLVVADPQVAVVAAAGESSFTVVEADLARLTVLPWLTLVPALFCIAAGVLALFRGRHGRWSGLSSRYERPGAHDQAPDASSVPRTDADAPRPRDDAQAWDRLSDGEDPTA